MIVSNKTDVCNDAWTTLKAYLLGVSPFLQAGRLTVPYERDAGDIQFTGAEGPTGKTSDFQL